ncbi:hypothetical protein KUCAC02_028076 [Chaenocephalus aceratus]|uniref:Uncharacterized protein n=1 Tax=Chaenocephalus aceratus TaxID=36190 RepID=A0ACB9X2U6_CHAAC|nr:hypothetical protein KUCAC02_028076 [Chaenocephalus aceratus]
MGKATAVRDNSDLRRLYNDILDRQIMELDTRFQADSYGLMKAAAACMPSSETFGEMAAIQSPSAHFGITVEAAEHTVFVQQLKRKEEDGRLFPSLMEVIDKCPRDVFTKYELSAEGTRYSTDDQLLCGENIFYSQSNQDRQQGIDGDWPSE